MVSEVFYCPYCEIPTHSKKGVQVRYTQASDKYGKVSGELRYLARLCKSCEETFYVRQVKLPDSGWVFNGLVSYSEFLKAEERHAADFIGSTAGEYTKRISRGVDRLYDQRYLPR